jgi:hypothetical protein
MKMIPSKPLENVTPAPVGSNAVHFKRGHTGPITESYFCMPNDKDEPRGPKN